MDNTRGAVVTARAYNAWMVLALRILGEPPPTFLYTAFAPFVAPFVICRDKNCFSVVLPNILTII